ncbi:MAG: DUF4214 domain-containing protein [Actinomycetota bacterium]
MTNKGRKFIAILATVFILIFLFPSYLFADATSSVEAFVARFYRQTLDREPDVQGLESWVNNLISGNLSGADVAKGFIFSEEFIAKNVSNGQFLNIMYKAFFDRAPDPEGYAGWLDQLQNGKSRGYVLEGFVSSVEFENLCQQFGISPGSSNSSGISNEENTANSFVLEVFSQVNQIRHGYRLNDLVLDGSLSAIAAQRANDMISRDYFSHTNPEGRTVFNILNENGIYFTCAAENINQASPPETGTPENFLNMWLDSGTHRDNILDNRFNKVGIGFSEGNGRRVIVMVFTD